MTGPIGTSKYENPNATITVKAADKSWTVTLALVSRMQSRGASFEFVEVRAERITVDGKTVERR